MKKTFLLYIAVILAVCPPLLARQPATDTPVTSPSALLEPPDFYKKNAIPLTLKQVIFKTLENNLNIKISEYDKRIAEAEIQVQKGIFDLWLSAKASSINREHQQPSYAQNFGGFTIPNFTQEKIYSGEVSLGQLIPTGGQLSLLYTTQRNETNQMFVDINPYYTQSAAISFTQPLLKNFGPYVTLAGIHIAQNNKKISAEAFRQEVMNQLADVTKAYWDLVFAIKNYGVERLSLRQAKDFLRITQISHRAGVLPETDVLQAKAQVAVREENVIVAESVIKAAEDRLKQIMNLPECVRDWEQFYLPLDEPEVRKVSLDTETFIAEAFKHRPDYRQVCLDLKNKEINRRVARNQRLPELNFFAMAGASGLDKSYGEAWDELNTFDYHDYEFGLEFKFPLQNRQGRYRYKQAKLQYDRAKKIIENLQNLIILDVRNAVRNVETERKRVEATAVAVESEKAKLDSEVKRFKVGMATSHDVLEFQEDYAAALARHIQSMVAYNKALIDLERAKGTLLEHFGVNKRENSQ